MSGYSRSYVRVDDPYRLLALSVLEEAFRTIECYLTGEGSEEEIADGKDSIKWMTKMKGDFRVIAGASGRSLEDFHQMCIWKINELRKEAYNARCRLRQKSRESQESGEGNLSMV